MESYAKVLNAVKAIGGSFLMVGMTLFLYGFFVSDTLAVGIGLGAAIGAIFIFIMGVFFVATEEMLEKGDKGIPVVPVKYTNNVIPFKLK